MLDSEDVIRSFRAGLDPGDRQSARARFRMRQPGRGRRAVRADRRRRLRRREGAVGRFLGPPLRPAPRPRRCPGRPLRGALNLVEEEVDLGDGLRLEILRPPSADELIDEAAFDEEEFLPYWAELWPSGLALARHIAARRRRAARPRARVRPRAARARRRALRRRRPRHRLGGGRDRAAAAERRAQRRLSACRTGALERAGASARRRGWDLVLGADLLYEARNAEQLAGLLPGLGGEVLLAEPGRPYAKEFLERFRAEPVGERIYRLAG